MDYLQYPEYNKVIEILKDGFKPYYKWITFNTYYAYSERVSVEVLNLIINGLPSIPLGNIAREMYLQWF